MAAINALSRLAVPAFIGVSLANASLYDGECRPSRARRGSQGVVRGVFGRLGVTRTSKRRPACVVAASAGMRNPLDPLSWADSRQLRRSRTVLRL